MYKSIRISKESYFSIKKLYKLCFNTNVSINALEKKYDTTTFGTSHVGYLAINDLNEIGAYYGVFPIVLNYNSVDYIVAQSGDTMTAPLHQKKGLFIQLANETYKLAEDLGIKLIFGFPNKNSYPGFKNKLNWEFSGNLRKLSLRTKSIPVCELVSKFKLLTKTYNTYTNFRLSKYEIECSNINLELYNQSKTKGLIKKDKAFLEYKLSNKSNYLIKINGFLILLKVESHLIIGDVGFFDENQVQNLINTFKQLAKILLCKQIVVNISTNHWLYQYLKSHMNDVESLPIGFRTFNSNFELDQIQFISADADTF